jgi:hypothetical protein
MREPNLTHDHRPASRTGNGITTSSAEGAAKEEDMSEIHTGAGARGASRHQSRNAIAVGVADWLCLAAAPAFAVMALLTGVFGGGSPDMLCAAAQHASPLGGMVPMYLLMSAFHSAPWLKLISRKPADAKRAEGV